MSSRYGGGGPTWTSATTTTTTMMPSPPPPQEFAKLEHSDVEVIAHSPHECAKQSACPLHNRSVHPMRAMTQHWRQDRAIIERICEHGVGHFDPDQYEFLVKTRGVLSADAEMIHGCDGCCR
jgi:hypothetical protein